MEENTTSFNTKTHILLSHGNGGKLTHELIQRLFLPKFNNEILNNLDDSAQIQFDQNRCELCFTTDSYVVTPIFFPGADIGKLAVCGAINDLAVMGAVPLYMACSLIIEEGLEYNILEKIIGSMAKVAKTENVKIVTGDVKVVGKGSADKLFITTSGIGVKPKEIQFSKTNITPGDKIIVNGPIGDHGIAILVARGGFNIEAKLQSDCAPLTSLIQAVLKEGLKIKFMRDPTRGGIGTTLNEITPPEFGIQIYEDNLPVREETKAICELLGMEPLYLANEGKVIMVVAEEDAEKVLEIMQQHPLGKHGCIIGEVTHAPKGKVIMKTQISGSRIIDMPVSDQLPRIC